MQLSNTLWSLVFTPQAWWHFHKHGRFYAVTVYLVYLCVVLAYLKNACFEHYNGKTRISYLHTAHICFDLYNVGCRNCPSYNKNKFKQPPNSLQYGCFLVYFVWYFSGLEKYNSIYQDPILQIDVTENDYFFFLGLSKAYTHTRYTGETTNPIFLAFNLLKV